VQSAAVTHGPWFCRQNNEVLSLPTLPRVGLLTKLYHMPRALKAFSTLEEGGLCRIVPVFAQDHAVRLCSGVPGGSRDWVNENVSFYRLREERLPVGLDS
jgi:hypothetical protein